MGKITVLFAVFFILISIGCTSKAGSPAACTEDAKVCPDGSVVSRVLPDCEFAACPDASQPTQATTIQPPTPTFQAACVEGETKSATCPDGITTYLSENCVGGKWIHVKYIRDPCSPLPTATPPSNGVWVEFEPVQCFGNPWEQDWLESQGSDPSAYPKGQEAEVITDYYEKQGVTVFDVKSEPKYEVVCMACSCPRGDVLKIEVSGSDVDPMLERGFTISE